MIIPVVAVAAVVVLLFRRRATADADTAREDGAPEADAVAWDDAWGKPNEWDRRYPDARVDKPLAVNMDDFDPTFRAKLEAAFAAMQAQGFDPYVFEGARTQKRQAYLYGQGRPTFATYGRDGNKVTWTLDASKHGAYPCRAADVISKTTYWSDPAFFTAWGKAAEAQGLRWLGSIGDKPHVELA